MSDIFNEIDEDLRRDRLANLWKRHGNLLIGIAVVVVLGTGGWRTWSYFEQQKAEAAGARFTEALKLSSEGKGTDAETSLEAMSRDAPAGYRSLARFRLAADLSRRDAQATMPYSG